VTFPNIYSIRDWGWMGSPLWIAGYEKGELVPLPRSEWADFISDGYKLDFTTNPPLAFHTPAEQSKKTVVLPNGNLLSAIHPGTLLLRDPTGTPIATWADTSAVDPTYAPSQVVTDLRIKGSSVYVRTTNLLIRYDLDGNVVQHWYMTGSGPDSIVGPYTALQWNSTGYSPKDGYIELSDDQNVLYWTNAQWHEPIYRTDISDAFPAPMSHFLTEGPFAWSWWNWWGLRLLPNGDMIASYYNGIYLFDSGGALKGRYGEASRGFAGALPDTIPDHCLDIRLDPDGEHFWFTKHNDVADFYRVHLDSYGRWDEDEGWTYPADPSHPANIDGDGWVNGVEWYHVVNDGNYMRHSYVILAEAAPPIPPPRPSAGPSATRSYPYW
jgi:hypothetical protein